VKHPKHPNAVYMGEFHGYKCWAEPDEAYLAKLQQETKKPGRIPALVNPLAKGRKYVKK